MNCKERFSKFVVFERHLYNEHAKASVDEYKSSEFIYHEKVMVIDKKEIMGGRTKHRKNIFKRVFKSVQNDQTQDHNEKQNE